MVSLSSYDKELIAPFFPEKYSQEIIVYDVSLFRKSGQGYVGTKIIFEIIHVLAGFLKENRNSILSFYCDPVNEIQANHADLLPQEYRSRLFTRMFEKYTHNQQEKEFINKVIKIVDGETIQLAHFICQKDKEEIINGIEKVVMESK